MTFPGDDPNAALNFEIDESEAPAAQPAEATGPQIGQQAQGKSVAPASPASADALESQFMSGAGPASAGAVQSDPNAPPVPKNHDGTAIDPGDVFFANPEDAIGQIISGTTNVNRRYKQGVRSTWRGMKVLMALIGASIGAGIGFTVGAKLGDIPFLVMGSGLCVAGFFGLSALVRPLHKMSLVGTAGFVSYERRGWGGQPKAELRLFSGVDELRIQNVRHYTNGAYTGDSFNYNWFNQGRRVFGVAGRYYAHKTKPIPADNSVHMAWAAEREWSIYRLPVVFEAVERGEIVRFRVGRKDSIGVGKGFLELNFKGQVQQVQASEIQNIQVVQGFMTLSLVGSKKGLFSSQGVFKFAVAQAADFRLMTLLIEKELNIRIY